MSDLMKRAEELKDVIVKDRRTIHETPEINAELPETTKYVIKCLKEMGYEPKEICNCGVVATTTPKPGKVLLLRADMDALPMQETSGVDFASKNNYAHTCGHDCHTAILLGAARLLKEREDELEGTVKFMFQPDEEGLTGAQAMIDAGVMENPKVDGAFGMHITGEGLPCGHIGFHEGPFMASSDRFTITIHGKGGHGAYPHTNIDPINVAAHTHIALQEIISREVNTAEPAVLTIGSIHAGDAPNIIPEYAVMEGSIRTYNNDVREYIKSRLVEIAQYTALKFRCTAEVVYTGGVCPLINESAFTKEMHGYISDFLGVDKLHEIPAVMGSEDFALLTGLVPGAFFNIGAEVADPEGRYSCHNPNVVFDESALPIGAATFANCAIQWLKHNK
ncbi:M20 family metallopeptidase [Phocea massiliensis]|uniref:Putative hydrolase YxeP n=1 Tax=uncultured Anaerotruncus sp. TaxID=905011 RepID=A0A6N2R3S8_9FIRM|nr:M20 family metallopeptidase [Merdimmobilis hominis]MCD4836718.1 M20 family metallopeptidase [Merdimmobilis hominis]